MFFKIRKVNDWGATRYEKVEPEHMSTVRVDFTKMAQVKIRWPDGHEETAALRHRSREERVNDMGHEYHVRSVETFVVVEYRGLLGVLVPIEHVKVEF